MKKNKADKGLKIIIFALLIFGLGLLFSASAIISREITGNPHYYFLHQLIYGFAIGMVAFFVCQKINYKFWKKVALPLFFLCLILMALVFVPGLGLKQKGAQRWIHLGPATVQPAEFLKLGLVIYLAALFGKKEKQKSSLGRLFIFLAIIAFVGGLMAMQSDAGSLALIVIVSFVMYFIAGGKFYHLIIIGLVYAASFAVLIKFFPHRMARVITFLNPSVDPLGISYQINQALLAIGSGGLLGVGLGRSHQKYNFLPEPMGDSVFAIAAEEIGFIGGLIFIALLVLLIIKGFKISKKTPDEFGKLLAIGITSWIAFQAIINIGAITRLIPLTGIPLPFVSYGGSAMISILAGLGILTNISKNKI